MEALGAGSSEVFEALEAGEAERVLEGAKRALGLADVSTEEGEGGAD